MGTDEAPVDREASLAHLQALREQHRHLDVQITELEQKPWLSPEEQVDLAIKKKQKLWMKDQIYQLASRLGQET
ncbi:MAG TPA: YdcH family protein [Myxococcota bacterium]|nr:YdcH family protein [Myxococcota bacterium]HQK50052.1 YdcH family protein [Myxococcota bacterium]